jgi:plastocyanin
MKTIKKFSPLAYALIPVKILVLFLLVSCSKSSNSYTNPSPNPGPGPGKGANSVAIANMAFSPTSLTVAVNTMVTWTNNDAIAHTVTSTTGLFDSGSISTGVSFSYTFTSAGTYSYFCSIHPMMTAKIIVQ